ncbi:hypothetical protein [Actinacidiphila sp. bgisy145]|uniref:hypothetical protein n=1 Tax=Actinacidiphila sp. bgisy145 TaxID=3413792 RepID=UPI003EC084F0
MPRRTDQLPPDATTLARRIAALERAVRELRASRRTSYADIGGGTTVITGTRIQSAADGARGVIDADDGSIQIYDADDHLTNYMGGADNTIWNQAGWDDDGTPDGEFVAMWIGNFVLGVGNSQDIELGTAGLLGVLGVGFGAVWQSPSDAAQGMDMNAFVRLMAGSSTATTGTTSYPAMQVDGDVAVQGAVVKQSTTWDPVAYRYAPVTWQTPTWATGWASGGTLGGNSTFRGLQYRLTAEDEVWVYGAAVASSGAGTTVTTLPAGYRPPTNKRCLIRAYFSSGSGTPVSGWAQVTEAGVINVSSSLSGWTVAAGTQVFLDGRFPLGNIP